MVVVMRVGLLAPAGARPATAAFATLYETLVMMAAGGVIAALGFALCPVDPLPIPLGSGRVVSVPLLWFAWRWGWPSWCWSSPGSSPGCRQCSACRSQTSGPRRCRGSLKGCWARACSGRSRLVLAGAEPGGGGPRPRAVAGVDDLADVGRERGAGDGGRVRGRDLPGRPGGPRGGAADRPWPPSSGPTRRSSPRSPCGWPGCSARSSSPPSFPSSVPRC